MALNGLEVRQPVAAGVLCRGDCAELCNLLATEGFDVMLLPIVLWSAGTLFKCLDRATTEMDIPNARKRKLYSHLHSIHTLQNCVPTAILGKTQANLRSKGKNKRQIASLSHPTLSIGLPACPFTPNGVYFYFYFIGVTVWCRPAWMAV